MRKVFVVQLSNEEREQLEEFFGNANTTDKISAFQNQHLNAGRGKIGRGH